MSLKKGPQKVASQIISHVPSSSWASIEKEHPAQTPLQKYEHHHPKENELFCSSFGLAAGHPPPYSCQSSFFPGFPTLSPLTDTCRPPASMRDGAAGYENAKKPPPLNSFDGPQTPSKNSCRLAPGCVRRPLTSPFMSAHPRMGMPKLSGPQSIILSRFCVFSQLSKS